MIHESESSKNCSSFEWQDQKERGRLCPKRCLVKVAVTQAVPFGDHWRGWRWPVEEFSHRLEGRRTQGWPLPGVATLVPLREPAGLDTNNTLLGRKVLERSRGLAQGDQVLPDGRNAQNCLFRKEFRWGAELHGEYWQWNEGCKLQLVGLEKSCDCDSWSLVGKS